MPTACRLVNVSKLFGETLALRGVSLEVHEGELLALVGPSGSGKTTALRVIAGLETPDGGEVWLGDRLASNHRIRLHAEDRGLGMVFQGLALWGHMTVEGHLDFCLGGRGVPRRERPARIEEALRKARLDCPRDRYPHQLSGGQAQRLAFARAIVTRPRLVLLDEPLANLDTLLAAELLDEIRSLHSLTGIAFVHVTHDLREAFAVADRVAIMREGRLEQIGSPSEVRERPSSEFVERFVTKGSGVGGKGSGSRCEGVEHGR